MVKCLKLLFYNFSKQTHGASFLLLRKSINICKYLTRSFLHPNILLSSSLFIYINTKNKLQIICSILFIWLCGDWLGFLKLIRVQI